MNTKKILSFLFCIGLIGGILGLYSFTSQPSSADYIKPDDPDWKNLKVLPQDISKDSLFNLMEGYTIALGVECSYCHAPKKHNPRRLDFASDKKIEKEIARGMIKMTAEINEQYFKPFFPEPKPKNVHVINCVMCHRGTANPELYLSKMSQVYKTYKEGRDNRKEIILNKRRAKKD